ncbi:nitrite reductase small subunit NirD [Roseateles saccharophilus]|uniref:Assimilatory nitrite reductase (NAD(P)H) small subunit n=1 Tax=Roseateles saccharophilus TaxID=304 RepID=A0A4V2VS61_ROSSA|nr:nitrite reductase small subunit NirD [Roseateles saccharophilus]MDG0831837.1 nitrite reductase small subunit NirD [Roseateles saccharophilus]TCV01140.1 assimilatory nitrite reductase (NAD(P)H) small subunit [Roseateles saccharophilus]
MNDWTRICSLQDIPVLGSRRVQRPAGMDVALFRNAADEVFALLDRCPHKGGPLSMGLVFGRSVACPLHNWTIALDDGCAREPDVGCTQAFQVKLDGDAVYLLQSELDTLALDLAAPVAGPKIPIAAA